MDYIDDDLRNYAIIQLNAEGLPVNNSTIKMMADKLTKPDPNKPKKQMSEEQKAKLLAGLQKYREQNKK